MPRGNGTKWRKSEIDEITKAVRNFNRKIDRITKQNPEIANVLPQFWNGKKDPEGRIVMENKINANRLLEQMGNRWDYRRELKALKSFTDRKNVINANQGIVRLKNNDNNLAITEWQYNEMKKRTKSINAKRRRRLEDISNLEVKLGGEGLGYTVGDIGMGKLEKQALAPLKPFSKSMGRREVNRKFSGMMIESQSEYFDEHDRLLRENYIKGLQAEFGDDAAEIIQHIEDMDIKLFRRKFYSEQDASFENIYRPNDEQREAFLDKLRNDWLPKPKPKRRRRKKK